MPGSRLLVDANRTRPASAPPLRLRARPQPVTHINRKVVIGGAALLLVLISLIVLLALRPPSLRVGDRHELFNVEYKPMADALSKLPATYDEGIEGQILPRQVDVVRLAALHPLLRDAAQSILEVDLIPDGFEQLALAHHGQQDQPETETYGRQRRHVLQLTQHDANLGGGERPIPGAKVAIEAGPTASAGFLIFSP